MATKYKVPASDHAWSYDVATGRTCCEYPTMAHEATEEDAESGHFEARIAAIRKRNAELVTRIEAATTPDGLEANVWRANHPLHGPLTPAERAEVAADGADPDAVEAIIQGVEGW
jgi:hypothetical protein